MHATMIWVRFIHAKQNCKMCFNNLERPIPKVFKGHASTQTHIRTLLCLLACCAPSMLLLCLPACFVAHASCYYWVHVCCCCAYTSEHVCGAIQLHAREKVGAQRVPVLTRLHVAPWGPCLVVQRRLVLCPFGVGPLWGSACALSARPFGH
jgi:hypothetical protein